MALKLGQALLFEWLGPDDAPPTAILRTPAGQYLTLEVRHAAVGRFAIELCLDGPGAVGRYELRLSTSLGVTSSLFEVEAPVEPRAIIRRMSSNRGRAQGARIYGLAEWSDFVEQTSRCLFGLSAKDFSAALDAGTIDKSGSASDLASLLLFIDRLRGVS